MYLKIGWLALLRKTYKARSSLTIHQDSILYKLKRNYLILLSIQRNLLIIYLNQKLYNGALRATKSSILNRIRLTLKFKKHI